MTKQTTQSKKNTLGAQNSCGSGKCRSGGGVGVKGRVLATKPVIMKRKAKGSSIVNGNASKKQNSMTVVALKEALKAAGVPYEKSDKKAELLIKYGVVQIMQKSEARGTKRKPIPINIGKSCAATTKKQKQNSLPVKFTSMLDDCGIGYDENKASLPFTDIVCGVVDAAIKLPEQEQIKMFRILIENVKHMHVVVGDDARVYDNFDENIEPNAVGYFWCLLIASKIITSWDHLLTEIGHQYKFHRNGELAQFNRYLDVVDTADALRKAKLLSTFQYGIVTGDGAYKGNKKNQKASWEVLRYLFDEENRFEEDTWDALRKHGKKMFPVTKHAMEKIAANSSKRKPHSNAKQFYKNQQKYWTKDELVTECKRRQIPYSGSKLKLMERCREYENQLNLDSDYYSSSSSDSSSSDSYSDDSSSYDDESDYDSD